MTKYILKDFLHTVGANVSKTSILGICKKPYVTSYALNLTTDVLG